MAARGDLATETSGAESCTDRKNDHDEESASLRYLTVEGSRDDDERHHEKEREAKRGHGSGKQPAGGLCRRHRDPQRPIRERAALAGFPAMGRRIRRRAAGCARRPSRQTTDPRNL